MWILALLNTETFLDFYEILLKTVIDFTIEYFNNNSTTYMFNEKIILLIVLILYLFYFQLFSKMICNCQYLLNWFVFTWSDVNCQIYLCLNYQLGQIRTGIP